MNKEEVIIMVQQEYEQFRSRLIDGGKVKAEIQVDVLPDDQITAPNQVCAYFPYQNRLRMVFCESEINNDYAMLGSPMEGATWKTFLRHEVIHEYQYKCVTAASDQGERLMLEYPSRFAGNGHDETFYTAICECAARLGMDSRKLLESI